MVHLCLLCAWSVFGGMPKIIKVTDNNDARWKPEIDSTLCQQSEGQFFLSTISAVLRFWNCSNLHILSILHACVNDPCFQCLLVFSFLRKQQTLFDSFQRYYTVHRPVSEVDNIHGFRDYLGLSPGTSNEIIKVVTPNTWK